MPDLDDLVHARYGVDLAIAQARRDRKPWTTLRHEGVILTQQILAELRQRGVLEYTTRLGVVAMMRLDGRPGLSLFCRPMVAEVTP